MTSAVFRCSPSIPETKARRTNSLAFAKSDCHTCSSQGVACDRQRPRCMACQNSGILCQGYSMQLTWHKNHSAVDKPPKVKRAIVSIAAGGRNNLNRAKSEVGQSKVYEASGVEDAPASSPLKFVFASDRPAKRRKRQGQPDASLPTAIAARKQTTPHSHQVKHDRDLDCPQSSPETTISIEYAAALNSPNYEIEWTEQPTLPSPPLFVATTPSFNPALKAALPLWQSPPDILPEEVPDTENMEQCLQIQRNDTATTVWLGDVHGGDITEPAFATDLIDSPPNRPSFIPCVLYPTIFDKFHELFNMYDQEFCKYPITYDFSINPYRHRPEAVQGSQHLFHAIIAISSHFRLRSPGQLLPPEDAINHKNTAMVMYQGALTSNDLSRCALGLLDTVLTLWQLEVGYDRPAYDLCVMDHEADTRLFKATISALNIWRSHLSDAYNLLESCGGVGKWSLSRKTQVQVSMILWWDAMVALLARTECVLPYTYFEAVLKFEGTRRWSFYELNGCPRALLVPMMQLASLAPRTRAGSVSSAVSRLVEEIERSVRTYVYQQPASLHGSSGVDGGFDFLDSVPDDDDEESLHTERDRYHCCEAFRHALLIYIYRIFHAPRTLTDHQQCRRVKAQLSLHSRITLDHVAACRATRMIQKQLLFPVFVAGAETRMPAHRDFVAEFCHCWYQRFGYQMYTTVLDILESLWAHIDGGGAEDTDNGCWSWIDELDMRRAVEGDFVQFCFG